LTLTLISIFLWSKMSFPWNPRWAIKWLNTVIALWLIILRNR
jgi:hypothetical protein